MKRYKLVKNLSNGLLVVGAVMCAVALYLIISSRVSLPPGVCPADNYQPLTFAAIAILVTSLVLSFIADAIKKRLDSHADPKQTGGDASSS